MKRWLILLIAPLPAISLIAFFIALSAPASPGPQGFLSATPAPHSLIPSPTYPVFSATLEVLPDKSQGAVDDFVSVRVSIQVSEGCHYSILDLRLFQTGEDAPIFAYISPVTDTVGPGVANPFTYTLQAVSPGTVSFAGSAYGERNCGDGFMWRYVGGVSMPVTIVQHIRQVYLPAILGDR